MSDKKEKEQGGEIVYESKLSRWLDNYWYHYKWATIGVVFALVVILICTLQTCNKDKNDVSVLYAGPEYFMFNGEGVDNIESALEYVLPDDLAGKDEKKTVALVYHQIFSEDEIKAIKAEAEKNGEEAYIDVNFNSQNLKAFQNLILAGEYSVCLLSPYLYEMVQESGGFRLLSDVLGYTPEGAVDECGVRLCDTAFGQYYPGVKDLPKDTILCLRSDVSVGSFVGGKKNKEQYKKSEMLFRAIIEFEE